MNTDYPKFDNFIDEKGNKYLDRRWSVNGETWTAGIFPGSPRRAHTIPNIPIDFDSQGANLVPIGDANAVLASFYLVHSFRFERVYIFHVAFSFDFVCLANNILMQRGFIFIIQIAINVWSASFVLICVAQIPSLIINYFLDVGIGIIIMVNQIDFGPLHPWSLHRILLIRLNLVSEVELLEHLLGAVLDDVFHPRSIRRLLPLVLRRTTFLILHLLENFLAELLEINIITGLLFPNHQKQFRI